MLQTTKMKTDKISIRLQNMKIILNVIPAYARKADDRSTSPAIVAI